MQPHDNLDILEKIKRKELTPQEALELIKKQKHPDTDEFDDSYSFSFDDPILKDHTVLGTQVLLGMVQLSLAVDAFQKKYPDKKPGEIEKFVLLNTVDIHPGETVQLRVDIDIADKKGSFKSLYRPANRETIVPVASGNMVFRHNKYKEKMNLEDLKQGLSPVEIRYDPSIGPSLRGIQELYVSEHEVFARLELTPVMKNLPLYCKLSYHPALLLAAHYSSLAALSNQERLDNPDIIFMPFSIKKVTLFQPLPETCYSFSKITGQNSEIIMADIYLYDRSGSLAIAMEGFTHKQVYSEEWRNRKIQPLEIPKQPPAEVGESQDLFQLVKNYLESKLVDVGCSDIAIKTGSNFMEMGLDSVHLIELTTELEKGLGVELYPTLLFEYQSPLELVEYFLQHHYETLVRYFNLPGTNREKKETPEIEPTSHRTGAVVKARDHDIAIIGMACQFALSEDYFEFWDNIIKGVDFISEIPPDHWDYHPFYHPERVPGKSYSKWGSFIRDVDKFDHEFFGFSKEKASATDPQLRHLLEVFYQCLEDAGYVSNIRGSKAGMYVGASVYDYVERVKGHPSVDINPLGNFPMMLSNWPSFFFDLRGPSLTIDSGCASSLAAVHTACRALRSGECDTALVGGVHLMLSPELFVRGSQLQILSPTGRCHSFDQRADGFVRGEGAAALLLKPLEKAVGDGDFIHAVIKGSAVTHGGHSNEIYAPNPDAQVDVLVSAWQDAGIDPGTLDYIEAHGTGTRLGDPVEVDSLNTAFKKFTAKTGFCALGTGKAQFGHCEAVSGLAAVIKTVLSIEYKKIPAMPFFETLNPYIRLEGSPLYINRNSKDWQKPRGEAILAGVSSFGATGTNVHLLVQEYQSQTEHTPLKEKVDAEPELIMLSAETREQLKQLALRLKNFLAKKSTPFQASLKDIAYTLKTGRQAMKVKFTTYVKTKAELMNKLEQFLKSGNMPKDASSVEVKESEGNRVPLPTYPFKKIRCWIDHPLTSPGVMVKTGKADRRPVIAATAHEQGVDSTIEGKMIRLWQEILHIEGVERSDNFFQLGGKSLQAEQIILWIQREFGVNLPVAFFYKNPTVETLAAEIHKLGRSPGVEKRSNSVPRVYQQQEEQEQSALLAQVDQLPDEKIEKLLEKLLAETDKNKDGES